MQLIPIRGSLPGKHLNIGCGRGRVVRNERYLVRFQADDAHAIDDEPWDLKVNAALDDFMI